MTLVCNAGPIIALAKIDRLELLNELVDTVLIPELVLYELLAKPGPDAARVLAASQNWLKPHAPPESTDPAIHLATRKLDAGEKQVIELTASIPPPATALLDDAAGRRTAKQLGISVVGFAGLLLAAKQREFITSVSPLLYEARNQGYWLSDELIELAKSIAKE